MAAPYLSFYSYTYSNYQADDGSIINIQVSGDTPPYNVTITGPNGYLQNYVSPPTIPDQLNLEPGTYIINIVDAAGEASITNEIVIEEKPETVLTANTSNACNCPNCDCVFTISKYVHNSNCFKYELFDGDNPVPVATYEGCIGEEYHQFTGLCTGDYNLVVTELDEVLYTFNNPYNCDPGTVKIDDTLDVTTIVSNWIRFAESNLVFDFSLGNVSNNGTAVYAIAGTGGWSGLRPDGTIDYANTQAFFYTGGDPASYPDPGGTTPLDPDASRFLGTYIGGGYQEGEHLNDSFFGIIPSAGNDKKYFYDATLEKFVYVVNVDFATGEYRWVTFQAKLPIETNPGDPLKWPNATNFYTTSSNWNALPIGSQDYTIDPDDGNKVKPASSITTPVTEKINAANNALQRNGFYSDCKYITYTHEVTIGSTFADDDFISIILARTVDDNGISHFLTLDVRTRGEVLSGAPATSIQYNGIGFEDRDKSIYTFNNGDTDITEFLASPYIIKKEGVNNPWKNVATTFDVQGNVRVRITRSGDQGEFFKIEMTDTMGDKMGIQSQATKDINEVNDYNDLYTIEFALDDPATWLNAPTYATGDELLKFLGPNEFGYATFSQPEANFYHLNFIGEQSNTFEEVVDALNAVNSFSPDEPCDLCYLATNCEDPAEQVLVTLPAELPALDTSVTYVFNEFPDKCWTVEPSEECGGSSSNQILLNTGFIDAEENLGVEDQQDFNWILSSGDAPVIPTPAIISNQAFPGYGSLFNALWITQVVSPHFIGISNDAVFYTTFVLPSGNNPSFVFDLLTDVRAIVRLNGFIIGDTTNPVTYPNPIGTPSNFSTSNPAHFNASPAINTLTVTITPDNSGNEINGFALAGSITLAGETLPSTSVTIAEIFECCDECTKKCYELIDCEGEKDPIQTSTDLSQYVGQVINILTCPETCWTVTEIECPISTEKVYVKDAFVDCISCLPSPQPVVPFELKSRTVKPGYNTKGCSTEYVEKISCDYSEALYQEVITRRYGIEFCCSLDFDALDIKKQLMDFKMITDPDACKPAANCCPPCNVTAELLTFTPLSCLAPIDVQSFFLV